MSIAWAKGDVSKVPAVVALPRRFDSWLGSDAAAQPLAHTSRPLADELSVSFSSVLVQCGNERYEIPLSD